MENRVDTYEGVVDFALPLKRTVGTFGTIEVEWQATPREATTSDFSPSSGIVVFSSGQSDAEIAFNIIDDDFDELMEVYYMFFRKRQF